MIRVSFIAVLYLTIFNEINCRIDFRGFNGKPHPTNFTGSPLFLTPLLENGNIAEARSSSQVKPLAGNVNSYSGFFTVNKTYNSNSFFWVFPAETCPEGAPVLVWLQGGPGVSSIVGLFQENGPYVINKDLTVNLRQLSWTKTMSVLYIDNPIGTGYSFTDTCDGYARNEADYTETAYETIRQFFSLFPELLKNDFFIATESYGGKYAATLAYRIHEANNEGTNTKINLKGIALGNAYTDPLNMLNYGIYLYEIGLIDINGKKIFDEERDEIIELVRQKRYHEAFKKNNLLISGDLTDQTSIFTNLTGFTNYYNYLHSNSDNSVFNTVNDYVQQDHVRDSLHVGNTTFHAINPIVEKFLIKDSFISVAPEIAILLENYKLLFYSGQLDIIIAYPLTLQFLSRLRWSGAERYKTAPRHIWRIENNNIIAGYCKRAGNLIEVLVRDAGHNVPTDQPLFAFDLINEFVFGNLCDQN